jgi:hypothetical protein
MSQAVRAIDWSADSTDTQRRHRGRRRLRPHVLAPPVASELAPHADVSWRGYEQGVVPR